MFTFNYGELFVCQFNARVLRVLGINGEIAIEVAGWADTGKRLSPVLPYDIQVRGVHIAVTIGIAGRSEWSSYEFPKGRRFGVSAIIVCVLRERGRRHIGPAPIQCEGVEVLGINGLNRH